ncbi:MAG: NAD(P)H-hydrate dehydratase [Verrucomicrobia bacterium]|nr:NAD(P)H-hydrate dehydratase [Verrucomicrobiota bacterium]
MSVPVISLAQMRDWERITWAAGQTEAEVIRRVGIQVARVARQMTQSGDKILLLAGKGHNGDDVRAAKEHLDDRRMAMIEVMSPATDFPKLESALARRPALIIDGLFGIGLNRPLDQAWVKFIERINQAQLRVLSVDVPSGLNAETGETHGAAIEASITLTVGAPKQGMLCPDAWPFVGRLEAAADVGLATCPHGGELQWTLPEDFSGFPPRRPVAAHKGSFGHLAIVAGSLGYHGAAVLAARGAQRAQPGLITLFTHEPVLHPVAAQLQSVMVKPWRPADGLPGEFSAILIGPGLAAPDLPEEIKSMTRRLWWESPQPIIVDASALDWLPPEATPRTGLRVITPHPGEAARLLKISVQEVQGDRLQAMRELSRSFGDCWVTLKGHQSLVGRSTGEVFVNPSGNPHLAQGGSGDVLAGFLAGLLAQPSLQSDACRTLRYAVWQHGAVADALQAARKNWIVEELLAQLGNAF